jgi:hypothetical protein
MPKKSITAEQVRTHLLERIDAYQAKVPVTDAKLGTDAVGDHKVVARIRAGENFTLKMYQRLLDWLDNQRVAA